MPLTIPAPPVDASGGLMTIQYSNGSDTHRMRVHVLPFNTTRFIVAGGTPSLSVDDGNHDYAYSPDRPAGLEAGITDTFQAFVNTLKPRFASSWVFSLLNLYQNTGGVLTEVFPVPLATPIAGTNGAGTPVGIPRCVELVWNFRTSGGHRARIITIAENNGSNLFTPVVVSSTDAPSSGQALVAYLHGDPTGIVAHDGQKFSSSCHLTAAVNRRLRRHYGFA